MRKQIPSPLGIIALHLDNDRRVLVCQGGKYVQQRYGTTGWEVDEEPWNDVHLAMESASKQLRAARMELMESRPRQ